MGLHTGCGACSRVSPSPPLSPYRSCANKNCYTDNFTTACRTETHTHTHSLLVIWFTDFKSILMSVQQLSCILCVTHGQHLCWRPDNLLNRSHTTRVTAIPGVRLRTRVSGEICVSVAETSLHTVSALHYEEIHPLACEACLLHECSTFPRSPWNSVTNLLCQIRSELMRGPNKQQRVTPGTKSLRMKDAGTGLRIPKIWKLLHVVLKTLVKKNQKR